MSKSKLTICLSCGYPGAMSITEKNGTTLYYCHVGCPQKDLWKHARSLFPMASFVGIKAKIANPSKKRHIEFKWLASSCAKNTDVQSYFQSRGLILPIPDSIRFLPNDYHTETGTYYSVMMAGVTDCQGRLKAIHRTFLAKNGIGKAPVEPQKKSLGYIAGYSVHLANAAEEMAVSEGIENGLTIQQVTNIPTWAALSAGGMESLVLPCLPLAKSVLIVADNDANGRGQQAAEIAAARFTAEGRKVRIIMPPKSGFDINDLLMKRVK